jgi:hypothetical protein
MSGLWPVESFLSRGKKSVPLILTQLVRDSAVGWGGGGIRQGRKGRHYLGEGQVIFLRA